MLSGHKLEKFLGPQKQIEKVQSSQVQMEYLFFHSVLKEGTGMLPPLRSLAPLRIPCFLYTATYCHQLVLLR